MEVPVDIVLEWMASNGKDIPPGYEVGPDGALRVSNTSEVSIRFKMYTDLLNNGQIILSL